MRIGCLGGDSSSGLGPSAVADASQGRGRRSVRWSREPKLELGSNLYLAHQERSLIEPLPTKPASHFAVALARVARRARRHHVVQRVPATARNRQDAVTLKAVAGGAAVGASAPQGLQHRPLAVRQIMTDKAHAPFPPPGRPSLAGSPYGHPASLGLKESDRRQPVLSTGACLCCGHVRPPRRAGSLCGGSPASQVAKPHETTSELPSVLAPLRTPPLGLATERSPGPMASRRPGRA